MTGDIPQCPKCFGYVYPQLSHVCPVGESKHMTDNAENEKIANNLKEMLVEQVRAKDLTISQLKELGQRLEDEAKAKDDKIVSLESKLKKAEAVVRLAEKLSAPLPQAGHALFVDANAYWNLINALKAYSEKEKK